MASYAQQAAISAAILRASPAWARICELHAGADNDLLGAVVENAAGFAENLLAPLNTQGDRQGATLQPDGRVTTPEGFKQAWAQMAEGGWLATDLPENLGGTGLPLAMHTTAQMLFDRAAMAFGMLPGSTRCAAMVLAAHADAAIRDEWVPALVSGERSATICISEADAGSDLARIRTRAVADGKDGWRITGEKCWISYGDHDLTEITGHMVLARTGTPDSGTRGLSLFLVPSVKADGSRNLSVVRIEEKLGLHGSPTCVLSFDDAEAMLIGEAERGLPQLFVMIERMRLLTAGQGCGMAHAALDIAESYARERKQGGRPDTPPPAILSHPDVQRQIAEMAAGTMALHAFILELAATIDLAGLEQDETRRAAHADLAAFLLPIAKNFGGAAGFDMASRAIQVLGGAGYTREYPLEQLLRDARILTIFEGTTGMQALDLLHRRLWKDEGRGFTVFARAMRTEIDRLAATDQNAARTGAAVLQRLETLVTRFRGLRAGPDKADYGADALLNAVWAGVSAWMALRLINTAAGFADMEQRVAACGRLRLAQALMDVEGETARARLDPADMAAASGAGEWG